MDRAEVNKALTWLRPPYMREIALSNRYVYEATRQYPDRIIGFGWVDPHLGFDRMKDEIKRCIEEFGFYGIKLNGAQNNFVIDSPEVLPLSRKSSRPASYSPSTSAPMLSKPLTRPGLGRIAESVSRRHRS